MKQITADLVIEKFIETRDEIEKIKKECEARIADLKALQEKRSQWLLGELDRLGGNSLKTAHGSAFIDMKDSATVADWDGFLEWVLVNEKFDFLEHRVSKTAVKQRLEDGETLPVGVNYVKVRDIKVRRA